MIVARNRQELRDGLNQLRARGPLGFVATMGYLHAGHRALMQAAATENASVVVSIFVNPLQFNDPTDYERYPIDHERDLSICSEEGVALVFLPEADELFPEGKPHLRMAMPELTRYMCGEYRPGHFEGVLFIVARLFNLLLPTRAYFGLKDYQQYRVIATMAAELDMGVQVIGVETVREEDGRALSSRNVRLSARGLEHAGLIFRALRIAEKAHKDGNDNPTELCEIVRDVISSGSLNRVEYVELVDEQNLQRLDRLEPDQAFLIAVAVFCEGVRLIDNLRIGPERPISD
ncbi:MAG: pantoate--beta-alanine ligase [Spirochaetales bacterium]|nr:pantoate--beta-alanine ligase [Leptospiraceae bacterium]MCP5482216.1 pantoate--beta-alanine ligase [Spirochaetales bacterium]MCP5484672.1 pantoate--beta-alanine ligase [Spirochaetales bacterium]